MDRESLRVLLAQGESVERIAKRFGKHPSTIAYWMAKHGLKTRNAVGRRSDVSGAKAAGLLVVTRDCSEHGATEFVLDRDGRYRCRRCRSDAVTRRRRRVKLLLVSEAGGACVACGYDRHPAALQFHHLDPAQKRMVVSAQGFGVGLDTLRAEARKCVLLCANCHAEVECGALRLSVDSG
jgi:transposase-like protein